MKRKKSETEGKKTFHFHNSLIYCIYVQLFEGGVRIMQDHFFESLKLQRIDLFLKLVSSSDCSEDEKSLAIQWVSELTDELMKKVRSHEYARLMEVTE